MTRWLKSSAAVLYAMRKLTAMPMLDTETGLDRVLAIRSGNQEKPVVVSDIWDNPGGGVAGDATHILRRMVDRGMDNFAVATIWDPIAVSFCHAAGEGAEIDLRIGGKSSPQGGEPLDFRIKVMRTAEAGWQSFRNSRVTLGRAAVVRPLGTEIDIILITSRTQTYEPDIFSNLGIDFPKKTCCWSSRPTISMPALHRSPPRSFISRPRHPIRPIRQKRPIARRASSFGHGWLIRWAWIERQQFEHHRDGTLKPFSGKASEALKRDQEKRAFVLTCFDCER